MGVYDYVMTYITVADLNGNKVEHKYKVAPDTYQTFLKVLELAQAVHGPVFVWWGDEPKPDNGPWYGYELYKVTDSLVGVDIIRGRERVTMKPKDISKWFRR